MTTFPNTWKRGESHQKWDEPTRSELREKARAELAKTQSEVRKQIAEREQYRCRVCGKPCSLEAADQLKRGKIAAFWDPHHVTFRSDGGDHTIENECLLCRTCHDLIHKRKLLQVEGNANAAPWLTISRRGEIGEPFTIVKQEIGVREYLRD